VDEESELSNANRDRPFATMPSRVEVML